MANRLPGIAARFETIVDKVADEPAVISPGRTCSYAELNHQADAIASALRAGAAAPDQVVGVALPNGQDLVASLVGTLKAGNAYLGVDAAGPAARNRRILARAGATALIGPSGIRDELAPHAIAVDPAGTGPRARPRHESAGPASPDRLAYVCATSGTTGEPNGVAMPTATLVNLLDWELRRMRRRARAHGADEPDLIGRRVLHFARPTFDVCLQEVLSTLLSGGCLVTVNDQRRSDPAYLLGLMREHRVERAYIPPMVLTQLAHCDRRQGGDLTLWELVVAGGPLRLTAEIRQFLATLDRPVLDDQYGTTEVHTAMAHLLTGHPVAWPAAVALTEHVDGFATVILGESGQRVTTGDGEVHLRGRFLAWGYVGRPGLTAERFVPDPDRAGARMYRSGDLGRRQADGSIEVKGRLDDQAQVRGYRIELGEVEQALVALRGVTSASVVTAGADEHQLLVAFVVLEERGEGWTDRAFRRGLAQALPRYMLPDQFVVVDELPLNRNGKVDRTRLAYWGGAGVNPERMNSAEKSIASIWSSVLRARIEGPDANFFRCGGNSVLATLMTARARQHFGRELPFDAVFRYPVLTDLAKAIERAPLADESVIGRVDPDVAVGLPTSALGLWFHHQAGGDPCAYNCGWAYRVHGRIDARAFEHAVGDLVRRHEILRTVFREGEEPAVVQRVLADCPGDYFVERELAPSGDLAELITRCLSTPFDLVNGPLHRTYLITAGPDEAVVLFTGHHLVLDAWSEDLIRRDLSELYDARVGGHQDRLPEAIIQYRDFSHWLARFRQTSAFARQAGYWRTYLAGAPAEVALPLERPRSEIDSAGAASRPIRLHADVAGSLRVIAVREGVTMAVVLASLYGLALKAVSGMDDIVVGMPASGRTRAGLDDAVGFFVNTLPVRMNLAGDVTDAVSFRAAVSEVARSALGAFANSDVPFDEIVRITAPPRVRGRNPLFQAWFVHDDLAVPLELAGTTTTPVDLPPIRVRFDLALHVRPQDDAIAGELSYRVGLLSAQTADRIAKEFESIAATVSGRRPLAGAAAPWPGAREG